MLNDNGRGGLDHEVGESASLLLPMRFHQSVRPCRIPALCLDTTPTRSRTCHGAPMRSHFSELPDGSSPRCCCRARHNPPIGSHHLRRSARQYFPLGSHTPIRLHSVTGKLPPPSPIASSGTLDSLSSSHSRLEVCRLPEKPNSSRAPSIGHLRPDLSAPGLREHPPVSQQRYQRASRDRGAMNR